MKPIRFKVLDIQEWPDGWVLIGHSMEAGTFQAGPGSRLAGCKVLPVPPPPDIATKIPAGRILSVFRLVNPADHERFTRGQRVLLDL